MSRLRIYNEKDSANPLLVTDEHATISQELSAVGVRFEQWWANASIIKPGVSEDVVTAAYQADIDRLMREKGYKAVDVVSLNANHPDKDALRQKFLNEHTHAEDEVRFFVAGSGLFTLHIGEKVYEVLCTQGDLISVPDNTRHWFDMGPEPYFVAIRLFTNPAGWVANYTGNTIAERFPRFEPTHTQQAA